MFSKADGKPYSLNCRQYRRWYTRLAGLAFLVCLMAPAVGLEVRSYLNVERINLGETVLLTLETDASPAAGLDLSILERDFRILARSISRQVRVVNGLRHERHELRLTLRPLRSGDLLIPAIASGDQSTTPLRLEVKEVAGSPPPWYSEGTLAPYTAPWPSASSISGYYPRPERNPGVDAQGTAESSYLTDPVRTPPPSPALEPEREPLETLAQPKATRADAGLGGVWSWILGFLVLAVPLTSFCWGRCRRSASRPEPSPQAIIPAQSPQTDAVDIAATPMPRPVDSDSLAVAISRVRQAYEAADPSAAREALLNWAALAFQEQPPANLALLAKRSPKPLHDQILLLERAFFSPQPLDWDHPRVWEHLANFKALPLEAPASFRQKKPLRRESPRA